MLPIFTPNEGPDVLKVNSVGFFSRLSHNNVFELTDRRWPKLRVHEEEEENVVASTGRQLKEKSLQRRRRGKNLAGKISDSLFELNQVGSN